MIVIDHEEKKNTLKINLCNLCERIDIRLYMTYAVTELTGSQVKFGNSCQTLYGLNVCQMCSMLKSLGVM